MKNKKADIQFERHEFYQFMQSMKDSLLSEYRRISKRTREDPGTAGDQGEENWANLLRHWLPANYPVVTKGRILNHNGVTSPQVDVLVLSPSYPLHLRDKKHYFAGGVVAAFECKLTLKKADLKQAFEKAAIIKRLLPSPGGSVHKELRHPFVYGLLAHSTNISGKKKIERLYDIILDEQGANCENPKEMLDVICIADTATFTLGFTVCIEGEIQKEEAEVLDFFEEKEGIICFYDLNFEDGTLSSLKGDILGTLIFYMHERMAFENPLLRPFSEYLVNAGPRMGLHKPTIWKLGALSDDVVSLLRLGKFRQDIWSEWKKHY